MPVAVGDKVWRIRVLPLNPRSGRKLSRLLPANSIGYLHAYLHSPDTQFELFSVVIGSFRCFKCTLLCYVLLDPETTGITPPS